MSSVLYPPPRPQAIGEVLDSAFRIFRVTLLKTLPYSVMATISGQLQNVYLIVSGRHVAKFTNKDPTWWGLYLLGVFLSFGFLNAISLRQVAIASGSALNALAALAAGFQKVPASIASMLLLGAAVGLCLVPAIAFPRPYNFVAVGVLGIGASYIAVLLVLGWPAMLYAGKGVLGGLRHSAHLITGNWWRTVLIYSVALTMIIVLSVTAGLIIGVIAQFTAARDLAVTTAVSAVMVVASGAVYMPFMTAMTLALFGDLEARKEGRDLERRIAGEPAV